MSIASRIGIVLVAAILALPLVGLFLWHDAPSQAREGQSLVRQAPPQGETSDEKVDCGLQKFANGATRVSPILRIDVKATNDDWAELAGLLHAFAESHEWSFEDQSETRPGIVKTLYLALCAPNQPQVQVAEQRWASRNWAPPIYGRGIMVYFYGDATETVWHPVAIEIIAMLETRWRVRFLDGGGAEMDRPDFLGEDSSLAQAEPTATEANVP